MKDSLDDPCFLFHDGQLLVFHTVSHRNAAADPFAFLPAGGHLVANPLGDDLPLILRVLRDRGLTTEVEDDLLAPITNVKVRLVGEDGNAFAILGRCRAALRKAGYPWWKFAGISFTGRAVLPGETLDAPTADRLLASWQRLRLVMEDGTVIGFEDIAAISGFQFEI